MLKNKLKPLKGKRNFEAVFRYGKRFKGDKASAVVYFTKDTILDDYLEFDDKASGDKSFRSKSIDSTTKYDASPTLSSLYSDFGLEKTNNSEKQNNSSEKPIFFAVSVSKKISKKAVVRNRIKRLMRESMRKALKENSDYLQWSGRAIFFWRIPIKKPQHIKLSDVYPLVLGLIKQASLNNSQKKYGSPEIR